MKTKKHWIVYILLFLCNAVFIVSIIFSHQYSLLFLFVANLLSSIIICVKCEKNENASSREHSLSQLTQTSSATVALFLIISQEMMPEKVFSITYTIIAMMLISVFSGWYNVLKKS